VPGQQVRSSPKLNRGAVKSAELASSLGTIVLGAGLALLLPVTFRSFAIVLLVTGLVVHAVGMTIKYRLEARDGAPSWWERALYWLCWASLAGLSVWIGVATMVAPKA
jgi:hypothetical protein